MQFYLDRSTPKSMQSVEQKGDDYSSSCGHSLAVSIPLSNDDFTFNFHQQLLGMLPERQKEFKNTFK